MDLTNGSTGAHDSRIIRPGLRAAHHPVSVYRPLVGVMAPVILTVGNIIHQSDIAHIKPTIIWKYLREYKKTLQ